MTGHINETNLLLGNLCKCKAKINGEPASFLFLPTVWVGAGKSLNK
jgi:hypothetical protein